VSDKPGKEVVPSRSERVEEMRRAIVRLKEKHSPIMEGATKESEEEFLSFASIEHAAIDNLVACAQHVIASVHTSKAADSEYVARESAMLLLQCATVLGHREGIDTGDLVSALVVFKSAADRIAPADAEETADFERLMYAGSN
jgi:hypothetical protein